MTYPMYVQDEVACPVLFEILAYQEKKWKASKFFGIIADGYNAATLDYSSIARAYCIANYACNVIVRTSVSVCRLPNSFMGTAPFVWDRESAKNAIQNLIEFRSRNGNGMSWECAYYARMTCECAIKYHDQAEKFINGKKTARSYSVCSRWARMLNDNLWTSARALSDNYKIRRYNTGDGFFDPFPFIEEVAVGLVFWTSASPAAKSREWYTQTYSAEHPNLKENQ